MESRAFYERADVEHIRLTEANVALRRFGHGEPVVFIHGFPTCG
jgi:pimeloyl-ACP methyl ester carboxylesterase